MLKKLLVLLLASVVAFPLATTMFAQGAPTTAGALGRPRRAEQ